MIVIWADDFRNRDFPPKLEVHVHRILEDLGKPHQLFSFSLLPLCFHRFPPSALLPSVCFLRFASTALLPLLCVQLFAPSAALQESIAPSNLLTSTAGKLLQGVLRWNLFLSIPPVFPSDVVLIYACTSFTLWFLYSKLSDACISLWEPYCGIVCEFANLFGVAHPLVLFFAIESFLNPAFTGRSSSGATSGASELGEQ